MELERIFPRDPRFEGIVWDHPSIIVSITTLYLWFVLKAGPEWMAKRKPFEMRSVTRLFNFFQVVANIWFSCNMLIIVARNYGSGHFSIGCIPPTYHSPPADNETDWNTLDTVMALYFAVRVLDYLDTVFFVLAKKQSHVSFLHVYHHVVVAMSAYVYLRSGWSPNLYYIAIQNSLVHVVMYAYYFLSTFPGLKPYLWWKKYLTRLQIAQFCCMTLQASWNAVFNCGYPSTVLQWTLVQIVVFLVLFTQFYLKNYSVQKKLKS